MREDTEQRLGEFFEAAHSRFEEAAVMGEVRVVDHRIAGRLVRLRSASPILLSTITRPFAHLRVAAHLREPELTVSLCDSRTSGVAMPPPPWSLRDYTARGDIHGHSSPRFRTSFHPHSGIFNMLDLDTGRALYWIKDAGTVPGYAIAMPLLPILHWWMARLNMQLVHAGIVGMRDGAALLAGQGGSGKSNTALSCVAAGLQYVSDDYALIQLHPHPRGHSVFCTARLHFPDLEALPFLRPLVNGGGSSSDKALFFLHEFFPQRLAADLPLRVILLPKLSGQRRTTWEPAPPAVAHRALTAVTLHCLPGAGHAALTVIGQTVKRLPCYFLHLGTDRASVPTAVRAILEQTK